MMCVLYHSVKLQHLCDKLMFCHNINLPIFIVNLIRLTGVAAITTVVWLSELSNWPFV